MTTLTDNLNPRCLAYIEKKKRVSVKMVHPLKQYQDRGRKKIVQCMEAIYIDVETSGSIDNGKAETVRDHMSKAIGGKKEILARDVMLANHLYGLTRKMHLEPISLSISF